MTNETLSILDLQDIVVPESVGLWPPAPFLWFVLSVVMGAVAALVVKGVLRWRRNRYRRAGLELLASAKEKFECNGQAPELVADLSELLKRIALAAFPREQVASLYGRDWLLFLQKTAGGASLDAVLGEALAEAVCAENNEVPLSHEQCEKLLEFSNRWIRTHKANRQDVE